MCGINGTLIFANGAFRVTDSYITRMRDTIAHRGPDGARNWVSPDGRIGLGHRRLSIIDPSEAAAPPLSNEEGPLSITYKRPILTPPQLPPALHAPRRHTCPTPHVETRGVL